MSKNIKFNFKSTLRMKCICIRTQKHNIVNSLRDVALRTS